MAKCYWLLNMGTLIWILIEMHIFLLTSNIATTLMVEPIDMNNEEKARMLGRH